MVTHYLQFNDGRSYQKDVPHRMGTNYGPGTQNPARVTCKRCLAWLAAQGESKNDR